MPGLGDVLRHLIYHVPGLSDTNRAEFTDAVNEAYGPPPDPAPAEAEAAPAAGAADPRDARIAQLEAELQAARAGEAPAQGSAPAG